MLLNFNGCTKEFSPLSSSENLIEKQATKLEILSFGNITNSLNKVVKVSEFVKREKGGSLNIKYKIENEEDYVNVKIKLKIGCIHLHGSR